MTTKTKTNAKKTTAKPARTVRSRRQRTAQLAKKRAALAAAQRDGWTASTNHMRAVEGKKATLGLIVQPHENEYGTHWSATAVSTPHVKGDGGLQLILDDHAHKIIGDFPTEAKAKAACEAFAEEWKKTEEVGELCGCGEIAVGDPDAPGTSILRPLVADEHTPQEQIDRAKVVVDKNGLITKNAYGPTGVTIALGLADYDRATEEAL